MTTHDERSRMLPLRFMLGAVLALAIGVPPAAGVSWAQDGQKQNQRKVYRAGEDGVTMPRLIRQIKPQYSKEARDAGIQGVVRLEATVDEKGLVEDDVSVTKSLDADLDQAAIDALKKWQFAPGTKDDKAVAVRIEVEMSFALK